MSVSTLSLFKKFLSSRPQFNRLYQQRKDTRCWDVGYFVFLAPTCQDANFTTAICTL